MMLKIAEDSPLLPPSRYEPFLLPFFPPLPPAEEGKTCLSLFSFNDRKQKLTFFLFLPLSSPLIFFRVESYQQKFEKPEKTHFSPPFHNDL